MSIINVLWTGGWDSTFRILQLSEKKVTIQPYYLKDNRASEKHELEAIVTLTEQILKLETTQCIIKPLITKDVTKIETDNAINASYYNIRKSFKTASHGFRLGKQYEWLARFSKDIDFLELGIHKGGKITDVINTYGALKRYTSEDKEEFYKVNKEETCDDVNRLFGNYHFPLINFTKLKMKAIAEEKGFINILNNTWFCHYPIDDEPCGHCTPCMQTVEFGLTYRFSDKGLKRYKIQKRKKQIQSALNLRRSLNKYLAKKNKKKYQLSAKLTLM